MSSIRCFLIEPTGEAQVSLRRFQRGEGTCPGRLGYCDAEVVIDKISWPVGKPGILGTPSEEHREDSRWPSQCAHCGKPFGPDDEQRYNRTTLWGVPGAVPAQGFVLAQAPEGAMWDATWWPQGHYRGPDGRCLVVRTPGGDWMVDGPSYSGQSKGPGWTRTGDVPNVTAQPSIVIGNYHGWLREGFLVAC